MPDPAAVAAVGGVVDALYDVISGPAGEARDWQRMRALFHPEARLAPLLPASAGARPFVLTVDDYIERSGPALERAGFFEQELARAVQLFGDFAHVWSTYEGRRARRDPTPFLRGINSIQLVRCDGRWLVWSIVWQQEHDAGEQPARYLPPAGSR